ncbi:MAG: S41 family peptidase [Candidatus Peribacteraceae bacterium]|nr:S41 family peptidase [Candidatus Peribacteraceae bacterium]
MRRFSLPLILFTAALPLVTLLIGWQLGVTYQKLLWDAAMNVPAGSGATVANPEEEVDLTLFWTVWRLLQRHYIAPTDLQPQDMVFGAVGGLVRGVGDPYTVFMPPQENTEFHDALGGRLQGIGAELSMEEDFVTVVATLKGSPAERAGLLPEDVISSVDGQPLDGLSLSEVVGRVRGPKGTEVVLEVYREGDPEPLPFRIVRDDVSVPTVESRVITEDGAKIGYVALNQFGDRSMAEVRSALQGFRKENLQGIVLDLRYNGGGYLEGAVELTSMFLREGDIVTVETRGAAERHEAAGNPLYPDIPLVVLINQSSASASEITAGALQDHGRATIMGLKSYGKGTVQEVIELPGGSSLRVTVARWLTPEGKNLAEEGVQPDIVVERGADEAATKKDAQLDAAVRFLLETK